jgi:hypothetical protein
VTRAYSAAVVLAAEIIAAHMVVPCFMRAEVQPCEHVMTDITWALVGLGLFVPGAAVRPPAVRLC